MPRPIASAPEPARAAAPPTAEPAARGPDAIDPYDAFGRLRAAPKPIFGYPVPAALRVTARRPGLVFGELRTRLRPVEEFYTHRDYLVVRRRDFLEIHPTPRATERVLPELRPQHARSSLRIFVLGPQRLRFRFEDPDESHPAAYRPFASAAPRDRNDPLPIRPPMVPAYDPSSPNPTRNVPPPSLNPHLPPGVGVRDVRPRIRAWQEAHPDRRFGD